MANPKILFTTNLGIFKFHEVNRKCGETPESKNRIKEIANSMKVDGLLPHAIVITNKGYIVDGQHRVKAAEDAGKGIYYIIDESVSNTSKGIFNAAKKYNRTAKVWSKEDYINGLSTMGNEHYITLENFRKEYPMFSLTEALMFLANSGTKYPKKIDFADGKFKVNNLELAREMANNLLKPKEYFPKGYNQSNFVRTMITIMDKKKEFDFKRFYHKVQLRPGMIFRCGNKEQYAEMIENLYNYKTGDKVNLRF